MHETFHTPNPSLHADTEPNPGTLGLCYCILLKTTHITHVPPCCCKIALTRGASRAAAWLSTATCFGLDTRKLSKAPIGPCDYRLSLVSADLTHTGRGPGRLCLSSESRPAGLHLRRRGTTGLGCAWEVDLANMTDGCLFSARVLGLSMGLAKAGDPKLGRSCRTVRSTNRSARHCERSP